MKTLNLPLKAKWYELIESGQKTEEYREIKPYWIKRLCFTRFNNPWVYCVTEDICLECLKDAGESWLAYPFDFVKFSYGYTKRTMTFKVKEIVIGQGKPEWGAEPDKNYFIIKLGEKI